MPWNGLGQRLANRNDMTKKPITTGMPTKRRWAAEDKADGKRYTVWAADYQAAAAHAKDRGWVLLIETTNRTLPTTHKPAKVRSTPF